MKKDLCVSWDILIAEWLSVPPTASDKQGCNVAQKDAIDDGILFFQASSVIISYNGILAIRTHVVNRTMDG